MESLGPIHWEGFSFAAYDRVLSDALAERRRIYSAAYIMPTPRLGEALKHRNHLKLLMSMMDGQMPARIASAKTLREAYHLLNAVPSFGPFLAFQYAIDLNYSPLTSFSEMEFVVAGPGAIDGLRKCFRDSGGLDDRDLIRATAEMAETWFAQLGLEFPALWGRPLQLIDFQNLFCEVGKYARQAHPTAPGSSGRTRIKQRYTSPTALPITAQFPPKWGLPRCAVVVDGVEINYLGRRSAGST
jgi:hypothetical protein